MLQDTLKIALRICSEVIKKAAEKLSSTGCVISTPSSKHIGTKGIVKKPPRPALIAV